MDKDISMLLQGNNGSVPDPWFTAYELAFYQHGRARLKVVRGRQEQRILSEAERSFDRSRLEELKVDLAEETLSMAPEIGGPERILRFYVRGVLKTRNLPCSDKEANSLFEKLLRLFKDDLPDKLANYLNT